jgi:hypothetical protein
VQVSTPWRCSAIRSNTGRRRSGQSFELALEQFLQLDPETMRISGDPTLTVYPSLIDAAIMLVGALALFFSPYKFNKLDFLVQEIYFFVLRGSSDGLT